MNIGSGTGRTQDTVGRVGGGWQRLWVRRIIYMGSTMIPLGVTCFSTIAFAVDVDVLTAEGGMLPSVDDIFPLKMACHHYCPLRRAAFR